MTYKIDKINYDIIKSILVEDKLKAYLDETIAKVRHFIIARSVVGFMIPVGGFTWDGKVLGGVFALKGQGKYIIEEIMLTLKDVPEIQLNCYGEFLKDFYVSHGFKITKMMPWCPSLGHKDLQDIQPNYYEMKRINNV